MPSCAENILPGQSAISGSPFREGRDSRSCSGLPGAGKAPGEIQYKPGWFAYPRIAPMADRKIICLRCRSSILAEWKEAKWSVAYSFVCPKCGNELRVTGSPPIRIYRMDTTGNWRLVQTIGGPSTG